MTSRVLLSLLALALAMSAAHAEPMYVIEQLVVTVSSEPGVDGERVGQVKSGEKLELLEREGDEAHVRLSNGREGWIKASYLSAEEPLEQRLAARTAELDKLRQEDDKLKRDVSQLQAALASARASPASSSKSPPSSITPTPPAATAAPPAPIRETVFLRPPGRPGQTSWMYLSGVSAVMLLAGFVLGWRTLDRRIRQKYGGLRIY